MKDEAEWWNVSISEEQLSHPNDEIRSEETNSYLDSKHNSQKDDIEIDDKSSRLHEIRAGLSIFLIGMLLPWGYPDYPSGYLYLIDFSPNISWFIEFNFNFNSTGLPPEMNNLGTLRVIGWLIFIITPLLLTINFLVMYVNYSNRDLDYGKTCSYIHFSLIILLMTIEFINWGATPPLSYSLGFNMILISGLCFNRGILTKIFNHTKIFFDSYGGLPKN